jgi:hypothetical protein
MTLPSKARTKVAKNKSYAVSLDFYGDAHELDRLERALLQHLKKAAPALREASDLLSRNDRLSRLSLASPNQRSRSLERYVISITEHYQMAAFVKSMGDQFRLKSVLLSIGVMYREAVTCTIEIPTALMASLSKLLVPVEITCYPSR